LEAAVQATVQDCPITLIAYDVPYPEPLHAARPIVSAFGVALVLAPRRTERVLASLTLAITNPASPATTMPATSMMDPQLERLRLGNPAARALPLLAAVARADAATIRLDGIDVAVTPP
jgi:hypothetical protein